MIIEEILLGKDEVDKKKKIEENIGKEVILNDDHFLWKHGVLGKEKGIEGGGIKFEPSEGRYQLMLTNKEKILLAYDDLIQLLILTPYLKL